MGKRPAKLLYLSPISWNFLKARPQFIAGYAAENGFEVTYLARTPWGKGLIRSRRERISKTLTAVNICVLPLALRFLLIEKFNNFRLKRLIAREKFDLIIVGDPRLTGALPDQCPVPVIFDCMDKNPDFYTGKIQEYVRSQEDNLCRIAAGIVVSAQKLRDILVAEYAISPDKISIVRNAAADDFLTALPDFPADELPPADLLYTGTIDHWFDWEAVVNFARQYPEYTIRIAGPLASQVPDDLPDNIELYGKVPHSRIAALIRRARLMIIPFVKNPLIEAVDPVKLYEYLALGKQVLSAHWDELDSFLPQKRLHFYRRSEEFASIAAGILDDKTCGHETQDQEFHACNNWNSRGKAFFNFVRRLTGID